MRSHCNSFPDRENSQDGGRGDLTRPASPERGVASRRPRLTAASAAVAHPLGGLTGRVSLGLAFGQGLYTYTTGSLETSVMFLSVWW